MVALLAGSWCLTVRAGLGPIRVKLACPGPAYELSTYILVHILVLRLLQRALRHLKGIHNDSGISITVHVRVQVQVRVRAGNLALPYPESLAMNLVERHDEMFHYVGL